MLHEYNNVASKPGVYVIRNTLNGRFYIGSCRKFSERCQQHDSTLKAGTHCNAFLQSDFNKRRLEHGNDDFLIFEVVEVVEGCKQDRISNPEATRAKMSARMKKFFADPAHRRGTSNKFRSLWASPEYRNKVIDSRKGLVMSAEAKGNHAIASKKMWTDPEYREKISEAYKDPEYKRKMSEVAKHRVLTEETKKKLSDAQKNFCADPERRQAMAKATKRLWQDPEYRARQSQQRKAKWADLGYRSRMSEMLKARWQDPAYREKNLQARKDRLVNKQVAP